MYVICPLRSIIDAVRIHQQPKSRLMNAMQIAVIARRIAIEIFTFWCKRNDFECQIADVRFPRISKRDNHSWLLQFQMTLASQDQHIIDDRRITLPCHIQGNRTVFAAEIQGVHHAVRGRQIIIGSIIYRIIVSEILDNLSDTQNLLMYIFGLLYAKNYLRDPVVCPEQYHGQYPDDHDHNDDFH